jgi:hypothetical protein
MRVLTDDLERNLAKVEVASSSLVSRSKSFDQAIKRADRSPVTVGRSAALAACGQQQRRKKRKR